MFFKKLLNRIKIIISHFVPVNYFRYVQLKKAFKSRCAEIDELKKNEKRLTEEIKRLEKRINSSESAAAELQKRIEKGETAAAKLEERIALGENNGEKLAERISTGENMGADFEKRISAGENMGADFEKRISAGELMGADFEKRLNSNANSFTELDKRLASDERMASIHEKRNRLSFYYAKNANNRIKERIKQENHDYYKSFLPERYTEELANWFMEKTGEKLDLENPVTFNQKIQWLKVYDSTPLKTQLADKYLVRDFVREKIGEKYLIKLLGVWDNFDDIDIAALPDKFVLKANHGCQFNYIVPDKEKFNSTDARRTFKKWLNFNYAFGNGIEPHYHNIKPRIIAEEYLENNDGLDDYKFWCFGGEPKYIEFITGRNKDALETVFYDTEWNRQDIISNGSPTDLEVPQPDNLDEMLQIARTLSQGFCHVRVDLYRLNDGTLKFGEMTFTSASGARKWDPPEWNKKMGDLITLPEKSPFPY